MPIKAINWGRKHPNILVKLYTYFCVLWFLLIFFIWIDWLLKEIPFGLDLIQVFGYTVAFLIYALPPLAPLYIMRALKQNASLPSRSLQQVSSSVNASSSMKQNVNKVSSNGVERTCPSCGYNNPPYAENFCVKCGSRLTSSARRRARDSFVDSCFDFNFAEQDDNRHWEEMKDLSEIYWKEMKEVYSGNIAITAKAIISLKTALDKYPDYDVLYSWLGFCKRLDGAEEARKIYLEGLEKSRIKAPLCGSLGMLEFEENNLSEAVKWWIRSCAIQIAGKRYTNGFSFLNLATIAKYLGLDDCYSKLLEQSKRIQNIVFDASGERQRASIVNEQGNNSIKQAIMILCKDYFWNINK